MHQNGKQKYKPAIIKTHNYRGFKINETLNRSSGRVVFKTRFQVAGTRHYLIQETRRALEEMIDEVVYAERRIKKSLSVPEIDAAGVPTLAELFARHLPTISKRHQQKLCERVFREFLALLPPDIKVTELKKAHFQKYIDKRRRESGVQTKRPILGETIDKELYAVSSALTAAPLYFDALEDHQKPQIPKAARGNKKRKREKLVNKDNELDILLAELRRPKSGRQTSYTEIHRRRLADDLEFRFETGLRRKEVARLKKKQYHAAERALRKVRRWKTDTVTKYFPLTKRAVEIIESRLAQNLESEFIFTPDGESVESDYRTLKTVCASLDIAYGRYSEDGFVPHDLRHNFGSEIIRQTDIETARELLGHSNITQTGDYLHTDEGRLREAIQRRDGVDSKTELVGIYKSVRRRKMSLKSFLENIKKALRK